jgi:hypothetical protein
MEEEEYAENISRLKSITLIFFSVTALVVIFWGCFPLLNTLYLWPNSTGAYADNRFRPSWYFIMLMALNILLPYLGFLTVMRPKSNARSDLYFIFSILLLFINAIVFGALLFYYLGYTNTVYSGPEPFNDYRWCCVYQLDHPELCPNTPFIPCVPAVATTDLRVNGEFVTHWIFCGVFLVLSLWHIGVSRLFHVTGLVTQDSFKSRTEGLVMAGVFLFINLAVLLYWGAFPLLNTLHVNGYPRFAIPIPPNNFETSLYGTHWWLVWLLALNVIPLGLFFLAMVNNRSFFPQWLHYWTTIIVMLIMLVVAVFMAIIWIFDCNASYSGFSLCRDYRWCCNYFSTSPTLCGNTTPCPPGGTLNLSINAEFLQHFIFAIAFAVICRIQLWLSFRMKRYGIFYK